MRKIIFCILLFFWALKTSSQDKDHFSTEFDANYYYYFSIGKSTNKFNYGFSALISKYIHKLKISSGLNYSTKSYYYEVTPIISTNYLKRRNYKINYLNFPIIGNIEMFSQKSFSYSILIGIAFNRIINYRINSYYLYNGASANTIPVKDHNFGTTSTFGATISKSLSNRYILNLSPFINSNLPLGNISAGFKISIEYLFKAPGDK